MASNCGGLHSWVLQLQTRVEKCTFSVRRISALVQVRSGLNQPRSQIILEIIWCPKTLLKHPSRGAGGVLGNFNPNKPFESG